MHSRTSPVRSIPVFEGERACEAADLQWARDAAARIAAWLPTASAAAESWTSIRVDVPKEVVHLQAHDGSSQALNLIALLIHAGWSAAECKHGHVHLYAARQAIEVVTDEGERFAPMYNPPGYSSSEITIDLSRGARRGCADGSVEWIPRHRIRAVRYLNTIDASTA
jgi:hypothetical protein